MNEFRNGYKTEGIEDNDRSEQDASEQAEYDSDKFGPEDDLLRSIMQVDLEKLEQEADAESEQELNNAQMDNLLLDLKRAVRESLGMDPNGKDGAEYTFYPDEASRRQL